MFQEKQFFLQKCCKIAAQNGTWQCDEGEKTMQNSIEILHQIDRCSFYERLGELSCELIFCL